MIDEALCGALIEAIYDAAADPSRWPEALCLIGDAYGGFPVGLGRQGKAPGEFWGVAPRVDPSCLQSYAAYYHTVNPIWCRVQSTPAGTVQTDSMVMPKSEFVRTEFYNDFLLPNHIQAMLNAVVLLDEGRQTVVTVQGLREFEPEHIRLHRLLAPHLQRAIQLNLKLAQLELSRLASLEALNQLNHGAILVDATGAVLLANREAEHLFSKGGGLGLSHGILHGASPGDTARLHALLAQCATPGSEAGAGGSLTLSRGPDRAPLSLLVVPLRCQGLPAFMTDRPSLALVFVTDPHRKTKPLATQIQRQFGLTSAEASFAVEILDGDGIQAAADRLAISRSTGRTHLARIFEKTGTHRQAELVRLLLRCTHGANGSEPSVRSQL